MKKNKMLKNHDIRFKNFKNNLIISNIFMLTFHKKI